MSHTGAKRMLFNMSDKEIVEDLKQQKMEKVIMQELADAPVKIKNTGLFADVDKRYGEEGAEDMPVTGDTGQEGEMGMGDEMGGLPDLDAGPPDAAPGLPNQSPADLPPIEAEGVKGKKVLAENMSIDEYMGHVNALVFDGNKEVKKKEKQKELIKENDSKNEVLNNKAENMINEIDAILKETDKLSADKEINIDDIDVTELEEIDLSSELNEEVEEKGGKNKV